jgi:hypothetical protein
VASGCPASDATTSPSLISGCPSFITETRWESDFDYEHEKLAIHRALVGELYAEGKHRYLVELASVMDEWRDWVAENAVGMAVERASRIKQIASSSTRA